MRLSAPLKIPDAPCVTLPVAFNTSEPAKVSEMPALIAILFAAVSVNEFVLAQAMGLTTVMLPTPVPLALVVVTTTLAVRSAVVKLPVVKSES